MYGYKIDSRKLSEAERQELNNIKKNTCIHKNINFRARSLCTSLKSHHIKNHTASIVDKSIFKAQDIRKI